MRRFQKVLCENPRGLAVRNVGSAARCRRRMQALPPRAGAWPLCASASLLEVEMLSLLRHGLCGGPEAVNPCSFGMLTAYIQQTEAGPIGPCKNPMTC